MHFFPCNGSSKQATAVFFHPLFNYSFTTALKFKVTLRAHLEKPCWILTGNATLFFIISYSFVYNEVLGTCVWNNIAFTLLQVLAKKVAVLFSLAQRQLSKQDHYGFGLRELKAALLKAGELKRSSPDLPENVALTMAVRYLCPPKGNWYCWVTQWYLQVMPNYDIIFLKNASFEVSAAIFVYWWEYNSSVMLCHVDWWIVAYCLTLGWSS